MAEQQGQWRVRDASGTVHVAPTPVQEGPRTWMCDKEIGSDPLAAVLEWIYEGRIRAVEVRGPGELFAHEQVAAERERCLEWITVTPGRTDTRMRLMKRIRSGERATEVIEARIRSGKEPPR